MFNDWESMAHSSTEELNRIENQTIKNYENTLKSPQYTSYIASE